MLRAVHLQNLKAFRDTRIPLGRLTLLSGMNGSGKSTVLQALGALRQSYETGALVSDGLQLNGRYVEWGVGQDVLHEDYEAGESGVPEIGIGLETDWAATTWQFSYNTAADLLSLVRKGRDPRRDEAPISGAFQYIRADRIVPAVHYPRSHEVVSRQGSLGARGECRAQAG